MFKEGNFSSTDLESFYDPVDGAPDLNHNGILANLKSAPEVANDGTIYSTLVSHEMIPILQKVIDRLVMNGATENDCLQAVEEHALQQAYYDLTDGTTGTVGPTYGTPAFEFHNARGHLPNF